jgi:hypothetical protein
MLRTGNLPEPTSSVSDPSQHSDSSTKKLDRYNVNYAIIILAGIVFNFLKFPHFLLKGSMWAEMGVNYFPNAKSNDILTKLFSTDSGYIPFGLRIISALYSLLEIPTVVIPFLYSITAILGTGLMVGFFCLKRFRVLVESDFLRFIICLFITFAADFETRTYINFTYFSVFFIFINLVMFYKQEIKNYVFFSFPVLIFSKPILLSFLPLLFFVFFSMKRTLVQKTTFLLILLVTVIQSLTIIRSNSQNKFQQDTTITLLSKVRNIFVYFFGLFSVPFNEFFKTNLSIKILLGISFVLLSIYIANRAKNQLSKLTYFAIFSLFMISIVDCVAISNTFGSNFSLLFGLPLFRYLIPIVDIGILLLTSTVLNGWSLLVSKPIFPVSKAIKQNFGNLFLVSILIPATLISVKNIHEPTAPTLFNSQWGKMASLYDSGKPVCIPIDPAGWTLERDCRLLNSDLNWMYFGGFSQSLLVKANVGYSINIPKSNNWNELQAVGILLKPSSVTDSMILSSLTIKMIGGGETHLTQVDASNSSGFLLFFNLDEPVQVSKIKTLSFQSSRDMNLGHLSQSSDLPAVLWYGK